ncbi:hypothetical protein A2686_03450 [Candidatus Woesebacteria bacterium RIFCSPHIGHO2_01_FULL_38_10]|uniref:Glycosyl transferase family 1 domain-containing protein n=1 Tax=Candidatus Woesebacteria bacterium RIFCSPLOWO2_01_FULL_39_10b TaxID=1802517 RepID=A0A1F8B848_9BACT|nr:MAG: hypothetical protein A2686_03450 [Candidatus Woesebacteria bacterium RIFCSPHIGHO2_01_FULL_38_10]OGM60216.1 MAG: hypothetical protein A2892_04195 [Candidatus Woesebacteria bacterium RIFCSPLOWO2_01_FULL_39_10b]
MKILFINCEYPPVGGGGGVGNKILAKELAKNHEVDILTSGDQDTPYYSKEGNVEIFRVRSFLRESRWSSGIISLSFFCISAFVKGFSLVKKNKYNIVHSFFALPSGLVGVALSKIFRIPHVLTIVGGEIYDPTRSISPDRNRLTKLAVRNVINLSDRVTSISNDIKVRARLLGISSEKEIFVIPLGFEPPPYKISYKKRTSKEYTLITIARLVERKGIQYLIKAMARLKDKRIRLVIVGDGPEKEKLISLSTKLNVTDRVKFVGFITGKPKYKLLSSADCFVSTSLHEGLGLVFFEAMYCGLPILATNVGGQTDFLEDGKTGFLVRPERPRELADVILKLQNDGTLVKEISIYNRKKVKTYYISKISGGYKKIYKYLYGY